MKSRGRHKAIGINDTDFRDGVVSIGTKPYEILIQLFNFGVEFMGNIIEDEIFMVDSIKSLNNNKKVSFF